MTEMRDDAELFRDAAAGGAEEFAPIVRRYRDAVFGVALARTGDFHDAEDVAQRVFIEAFERLGNLKDPSRLGGWLRSIAIHRSIDHMRARRRHVSADGAEPSGADAAPDARMARRELRDAVLAAIAGLSGAQRETTTLFYIDGYSIQDVAAIQEVPEGTVKRRLHDARKRLKQEMMTMVEGVLRSEPPREEMARRVFDILQRYDRPEVPWQQWDEVKARLREIGTDGIEGFIRALDSPHSPTRRFAVRMLTDAGQGGDVVAKLLIEATKDANKKVRKTAFSALFDIAWQDEERRAELMPHILPALRDRSNKVRGLAWHLAHFPGFAQHVPLEQAARAATEETEGDPMLRRSQRELLEAVLWVREGRENLHSRHY